MTDVRITQFIKKYKEHEFFKDIKREDFTCNDCGEKYECRYSFDLYNLSGDCLAEK